MELLNEYDETKNSLNIIRGLKGKLLREFKNDSDTNIFDKPENAAGQPDPNEPISDEPQDGKDAVKVEDVVLRDESKKLSSIVTSAKITALTVYPETGSVVMVGVITNMNDAQFQFTFPETDGCFFTSNSMRLTEDNAKEIFQLQGHYKNWTKEWVTKIKDYQQVNND